MTPSEERDYLEEQLRNSERSKLGWLVWLLMFVGSGVFWLVIIKGIENFLR